MRPAKLPRRELSFVIIGALAVLTAVLLIIFVLRLAKQPGARVNLGGQEFDVGKAPVFAPDVTRYGPLKFVAPRGKIDLLVQHLGPDPLKGWLAFEAHAPDEARTCVVQWQPPAHHFTDPCTGRLFPADGTGLTHYPVRVASNAHVIINLRQSTGTTPPPQT
jgi:hypothetical protein